MKLKAYLQVDIGAKLVKTSVYLGFQIRQNQLYNRIFRPEPHYMSDLPTLYTFIE